MKKFILILLVFSIPLVLAGCVAGLTNICSAILFLLFAVAPFLSSCLGKGGLAPGATSANTTADSGGSGGGGGGGGGGVTYKKIFVTSSTYNGNLGGFSGADTKCNADANYPGSGTYKALLVTNSTPGFTRTASPTPANWVLAASTEYRRLDGSTVIGTTTAAQIFDLTGAGLTNSWNSSSSYAWTGLNTDWTTTALHCTSWTVSAAGSGAIGSCQDTGVSAIDYASGGCSSTRPLICVEQ